MFINHKDFILLLQNGNKMSAQGNMLKAELKENEISLLGTNINPIKINVSVPEPIHQRLAHHTAHLISQLMFLLDDDTIYDKLKKISFDYGTISKNSIDHNIFREELLRDIFPKINNVLGGLGELVKVDTENVAKAVDLVQEANLKINNVALSKLNMDDLLYFNQTLNNLMTTKPKSIKNHDEIVLLNNVLEMYTGEVSPKPDGTNYSIITQGLLLTVEKIESTSTQPDYILLLENPDNQTFEVARLGYDLEVSYHNFDSLSAANVYIDYMKSELYTNFNKIKPLNELMLEIGQSIDSIPEEKLEIISKKALAKSHKDIFYNNMVNSFKEQTIFYFNIEEKGDDFAWLECNNNLGYGILPGTILKDCESGQLVEYITGDIAGSGAIIPLNKGRFKNEGLGEFLIHEIKPNTH